MVCRAYRYLEAYTPPVDRLASTFVQCHPVDTRVNGNLLVHTGEVHDPHNQSSTKLRRRGWTTDALSSAVRG